MNEEDLKLAARRLLESVHAHAQVHHNLFPLTVTVLSRGGAMINRFVIREPFIIEAADHPLILQVAKPFAFKIRMESSTGGESALAGLRTWVKFLDAYSRHGDRDVPIQQAKVSRSGWVRYEE